ncbi:MAG: glycosyltransferase [Thiolinea sp.]
MHALLNSDMGISPDIAGKPPAFRLAYVVKRFPRLSETFIINELLALQQLGMYVEVYSLMEPEPNQQHELLKRLNVPVFYLPARADTRNVNLHQSNYANGEEQDISLKTLSHTPDIGYSPFPGKRMSQAVLMQLQAAALAGAAQSRGIHHFHAHFATDATTVAMLASRLSGIPYSFTAHAKDIYHTYSHPQWDRAFLRTKMREARFTVTVSNYNQVYLKQLDGAQHSIIHRLYNGVDMQRLSYHEAPRDAALILGVGRLVEKKGFINLLDACSQLKQQGISYKCVIIGEGPERTTLENRITELKLNDQVLMPGEMTQDKVLEWIRKATVFALPCTVSNSGDRDGLPTVLLECMALGLPAVSTRVAGIPEIIDDQQTGRLVPHNSSGKLAEALTEMLTMPAEARTEMARAAHRKAERLFNLQTNVQTLSSLFKSSQAATHAALYGTG